VLFDLFALGLFGGFFIVPLYALIQLRSAPEQRARIIAANNILNALFMVVGALAAAGLLAMACRFRRCSASPRCAMRRWRSTSTAGARVPAALHRLAADPLGLSAAAEGLENIPDEGAAVLSAITSASSIRW
jgi:MFS family permease